MKKKIPPKKINQTIENETDRSSEDLADAIISTSFVIMAVINKIGAEFDLSLSLLRVLGILWDHRPKMTELADYLGLEKQTMSGLISRAEKRGLVDRSPNTEDRRATDVFLTDDGIQLVKRLRAQVQQAMLPYTDQLQPADKNRLQELLQQMLAGNYHRPI